MKQDSFLYRLVNQILREKNDTKVDTLRSYCALLAASRRSRTMYKTDPERSELQNINKSKNIVCRCLDRDLLWHKSYF